MTFCGRIYVDSVKRAPARQKKNKKTGLQSTQKGLQLPADGSHTDPAEGAAALTRQGAKPREAE